jgi:shikimate kinase
LPEAGRSKSKSSIVLVGFMGAGKTSVGQAMARQLGWEFCDLDDLIQTRENRTVEAIFRDSGEPEFRRLEHEVLRELLLANHSPRVIGLGGGAFAQEEVRSLLEPQGFPTVFLDAPLGELWHRCSLQNLDRPLARDHAQFATLYHSRYPYYLRATLRVETSHKPIETIVAEVISTLRLG